MPSCWAHHLKPHRWSVPDRISLVFVFITGERPFVMAVWKDEQVKATSKVNFPVTSAHDTCPLLCRKLKFAEELTQVLPIECANNAFVTVLSKLYQKRLAYDDDDNCRILFLLPWIFNKSLEISLARPSWMLQACPLPCTEHRQHFKIHFILCFNPSYLPVKFHEFKGMPRTNRSVFQFRMWGEVWHVRQFKYLSTEAELTVKLTHLS